MPSGNKVNAVIQACYACCYRLNHSGTKKAECSGSLLSPVTVLQHCFMMVWEYEKKSRNFDHSRLSRELGSYVRRFWLFCCSYILTPILIQVLYKRGGITWFKSKLETPLRGPLAYLREDLFALGNRCKQN